MPKRKKAIVTLPSGAAFDVQKLLSLQLDKNPAIIFINLKGDITRTQLDTFRSMMHEKVKKLFNENVEICIFAGVEDMDITVLTKDVLAVLKDRTSVIDKNGLQVAIEKALQE